MSQRDKEIRELRDMGSSLGDIGRLYGISRERVRVIVSGEKPRYRLVKRDGKRVMEHRWIMEVFLGRKLKPGEEVHHKNGVTTDNRFANLEITTDRKAHFQKHLRLYQGKIAA